MTADEIDGFLTERATGVLCLTNDRTAYGIPVAFAYDAENERTMLDLGLAPESEKREFIETTDEVCLTTYEWSEPHDWKSVVMSGSGFDAVQWTGSVTYSQISSDDTSMTISALSVTYMDQLPDL